MSATNDHFEKNWGRNSLDRQTDRQIALAGLIFPCSSDEVSKSSGSSLASVSRGAPEAIYLKKYSHVCSSNKLSPIRKWVPPPKKKISGGAQQYHGECVAIGPTLAPSNIKMFQSIITPWKQRNLWLVITGDHSLSWQQVLWGFFPLCYGVLWAMLLMWQEESNTLKRFNWLHSQLLYECATAVVWKQLLRRYIHTVFTKYEWDHSQHCQCGKVRAGFFVPYHLFFSQFSIC